MEVAELYLDPPEFDGAPQIALHEFQHLTLQRGESRNVSFELPPRDLSFVTRDGRRQIFAGTNRMTQKQGKSFHSACSKHDPQKFFGFARTT